LFVSLEFLKFKEEHGNDFFHIVQTPNLACEITLQVFTLHDKGGVIVLFSVAAVHAYIMVPTTTISCRKM
jgi:uroporphyrinogen-III decarboxylase